LFMNPVRNSAAYFST